MCGIIGYSGYAREGQWSETYDILSALFLASECRGKDAAGFVARSEPFKNCLAADIAFGKHASSASRFIDENPAWRNLRHRRCSTVLGHVRWATHGSPADNRNNHPLVGHSSLYLVHNGILTNHKGTAERHGLALKTECDSELILRMVESARHPAVGLDNALRKIQGSMAAVVYDGQRNCLYMARDEDRPLWLLKLANDRRWWFASTREILLTAMEAVLGQGVMSMVETLFPLACGSVHVLTNSGRLISLPTGRGE